MSVAQWEVVRTTLASSIADPGSAGVTSELANAAACCLATALELTPSALVSSSECQDAFFGLLRTMNQVGAAWLCAYQREKNCAGGASCTEGMHMQLHIRPAMAWRHRAVPNLQDEFSEGFAALLSSARYSAAVGAHMFASGVADVMLPGGSTGTGARTVHASWTVARVRLQ